MSYHNGSVWPHDNALIGAGLGLYGGHHLAARLLSTLFEASRHFDLHRLPELFCGFHRRSDGTGPTLYPVACAPQAWSAGAPFLLLSACLGLQVHAISKSLTFCNPSLPDGIEELQIKGISVGEAVVDVLIQRQDHTVSMTVLKTVGDVEVSTIPSQSSDA